MLRKYPFILFFICVFVPGLQADQGYSFDRAGIVHTGVIASGFMGYTLAHKLPKRFQMPAKLLCVVSGSYGLYKNSPYIMNCAVTHFFRDLNAEPNREAQKEFARNCAHGFKEQHRKLSREETKL
jgi:hypothetical protein